MSVKIENLAPEYFSEVTALLRSVGLPLAGLAAQGATTLIALDEQEIVGCAALELYGSDALLRSVAVAPARQGRGLGRRICHAMEEMARRHNVDQLFLLTETAAPFFVDQGFVVIRRSDTPQSVQRSVEFSEVCPQSATVMRKRVVTPTNV